jgi:hypothetical protein
LTGAARRDAFIFISGIYGGRKGGVSDCYGGCGCWPLITIRDSK